MAPEERCKQLLALDSWSKTKGRHYTTRFIAYLANLSNKPAVKLMCIKIQKGLEDLVLSFNEHSNLRLQTKDHCKEKNACFDPFVKHLPKGPARAAQYAKVGGLHYHALFGHQKSTLDKKYNVFKENTFKEYFDQNWLDLWDELDLYIIDFMERIKGEHVPTEEEMIPTLNVVLGVLKKELREHAQKMIRIKRMDVNDILIEKKLVSCV